MDQTKLLLGILTAISSVATILIAIFANRLESLLAHKWAQLWGKPLVGKKPSKQPLIIWAGFFVCLWL